MGQAVAHLAHTEYSRSINIVAKVSRGESLEKLVGVDVVIDFSAPLFALETAAFLAKQPSPLPAFIIGSTGWKIDERRVLEGLAAKAPVMMSANFSMGVIAFIEVLRQVAPVFEKLKYNPLIIETHHRHKKDAPSGTAVSIQRAISTAGPGNVQTHSIRAGEIIGDHEVHFYGPGDHIVVGHYAQDRSIFARGAIEAAIWLSQRRNDITQTRGILGMETFYNEFIKTAK